MSQPGQETIAMTYCQISQEVKVIRKRNVDS